MFESRFEIFGWALAVLVVVAMGVIVFTGPFHNVNKPHTAAASSGSPAQSVQIVTDPSIIGAYQPKSTTVKLGQSVKFKNVSNAIHTVTADNNSFNSHDIATGGGTWVFKPPKAGTFKYFCIYHPGMHGTLIVQG